MTNRWPPLTHEDVPWDVNPVTGMSRVERQWIGRTYRAAIPPHIAHLDVSLAAETLAEAEEAAVELSRFDSEMGHEIAPYASIILRSESMSSSRIENITAGARAIAEAEVAGAGSGNAAVILANVTAMQEALDRAGTLDPSAVLAMHAALLGDTEPDIAGQYRIDQVWIGRHNIPHRAEFIPPVPARVGPAVADLMAFIARDNLPAVAQAAISHAQFETIHPFSDGNGRTGRALLNAVLRAKGVTLNAAAPISAGLLATRERYIDALGRYRDGHPDDIVGVVARAALMSVGNGRTLVEASRQVRARWDDALATVRSDSAAHRLADGLVRHPVITALTAGTILGRQTNLHRAIRTLVEHGILTPHQHHRTRNMTWRAQEILDLLDAYADRVGRRR